jgi:LysM repeat protein
MPPHGRHRRHQPNRISQASLTVTAGSAGIALPFVGISGADASSADAREQVAQWETTGWEKTGWKNTGSRPVVAPATQRTAPDRTKPEFYTVVSGDTLFAIARVRDIDGGWERLYEDNREVIGSNPDLILPGQKLTLEGEGKEKVNGKATKPTTSDVTAPVSGAAPGTPYRATGAGWAAGYHTGVDFPVPTGTSVRAIAGGQVVSAGWGGAYGYQVVIRHADGKYSQYAHLSALSVRAGRPVSGGQRIGRSGSTGNTTGPHLHFEVRTGAEYGSDINPLAYLRGKGVSI